MVFFKFKSEAFLIGNIFISAQAFTYFSKLVFKVLKNTQNAIQETKKRAFLKTSNLIKFRGAKWHFLVQAKPATRSTFDLDRLP